MRRPDPRFWEGRSVLLTGHTGFKGSWLTLMLDALGARTTGFALPPEAGPGPFASLGAARSVRHMEGDVRDATALRDAVGLARPDVVLHLAAQAIVARGYRDPAGTFATNVTGTANLLDALSLAAESSACLVVTSDKVYRNDGSGRPFREDDPLGADEPYGASKAACEMLVESWRKAFPHTGIRGTARAGNVIGGGDFGEGRLIPDLVRADAAGAVLVVRQPGSTRPFQHVLDVAAGYLLLAEDMVLRPEATPAALNFGPAEAEMRVDALLAAYGEARGRPVPWRAATETGLRESRRLALDAGLAHWTLGWSPRFKTAEALALTAAWYEAWSAGEDTAALARMQVEDALAP